MLILCIRTDKPDAELYVFEDQQRLASLTWRAHRELAETIHQKIKELLKKQKAELNQIRGLVAYKGPGSFTGLRIGLSVANALADSLGCPIVGVSGDAWLKDGVNQILKGSNQKIVIPEYGALPHITRPKH